MNATPGHPLNAARPRGGRRAAALALLALAGLLLGHGAGRGQAAGEPESAAVTEVGGVPCLGANDLARLLEATKFWRSDLRKLVLRTGDHTLKLTQDNPFALVDDRTYLLPGPVRMRRGELQVPVQLFDFLWTDPGGRRVRYDARSRRLVLVPVGAVLGLPTFRYTGGVTRVGLRVENPDDVRVTSRGRSRLRLRFPGPFTAPLPDSFPRVSLVRSLRVIPGSDAAVLEMGIAPEAVAFRLHADTASRQLVFEVSTTRGSGMEWLRFAPELPPGERPLRVIVLDPGHGGNDPGVTVADAPPEKDLTLALARELKDVLQRRLNARVVLTRTDDRSPTLSERAEIANRARADVVLSLHFDGFPRPATRGISAQVPPATYGSPEAGGGSSVRETGPLVLVPWRDAATRFAVPSREVAEDLLTAFDLRGLGPTRLREHLPYAMVGVNAPGVLLECGTLTSPRDRARLAGKGALRALADAIADGLLAYRGKGSRP